MPGLPLLDIAEPGERHSASVRRFFENLLPEGQALDDAAAANRVSKSNLAGLLIALGRETAGALSIAPVGGFDDPSAPPGRRPLSRAELSGHIRARPGMPFTVWDGKVRLSIAGYQDKIALLVEGGDWYLVDGTGLASTHLLKPEPVRDRLRGMTTNELACMRLARAVGLPVAEVRLEWVPEPVLLVRRFDRKAGTGGIHRLHCIDGCQTLGLGVGMKYERPYGDGRDVRDIRDGASLPKLFALVDRTAPNPAAERLALLRWAIFQVLIANTDAYGKNLAFFLGAGGLRLAPAYDLVCCAPYAEDRVSDTLAMAVGDNFNPTALGAYD